MRFKIVSFICIIVLVLVITFYVKSGDLIIYEDIPNDKISAKELVQIAKPYVDKYWGDRHYYVGEIIMSLDKELEGKVEIWYKDDKKNRKGVPNIITVEFDTKEKKIIRIAKQVRDSKIEPDVINIEKWNLDSSDILNISKEKFPELKDSNITLVHISGNKLFADTKEFWRLNIWVEESKRSYHIKVDPYTGEVFSSEVK